VFGPKEKDSSFRLAGIPPWINTATRHDRHCIIPYTNADLLGKLLQGIARLRGADFLTIPRSCFGDSVQLSEDACWLLFCTHPLREAETIQPPKPRPFLTYYAFPKLVEGVTPIPFDDEGADATAVHKFLRCAEKHALAGEFCDVDDHRQIETAQKVGTMLQVWIESVTQFGAASFLEERKYFVPIPVALVRIVH